MRPTTKSRRRAPSSAATAGVVLAGLLACTSTPISWTGRPRTPARNRCGREGQVGVAAAEVDDPQRVVGGRPAELALVDRVGDAASRSRRNSSTWRYFAPGRLEPARRRRRARAPRTAGRPRAAAGPCRGRGRGRPGPASAPAVVCTSASPLRVTRSWAVSSVVSTCQLPNGSSSRSSTASRGRVAGRVVGGVRLRLVVRRDLEVPTGLEVDVAELDPAPPWLCGLLAAGRDAPDQDVGVEQPAAHPVSARRRGSATLPTYHRGDEDDQEQRRDGDPGGATGHRDRDHESTATGVHAGPHRTTAAPAPASSSARCRAGTPARSSSWTRQDIPSASTTAPGWARGPPAAGASRRPRPRPRSGPAPCRSCRPGRSSRRPG